MHPRRLRCSAIKYSPVFSVVAPCRQGASAPSVRRRPLTTGCLRAERKQPIEVPAEDEIRVGTTDPQAIECLHLRVVEGPLPTAREERRVGAEEQALGPRDL